MRAIRQFTVRPVLPQRLTALGDLAQNLRWSWHPETQDIFAAIDADAWSACAHDPVRMLGAVSVDRLEELSKDEEFLGRLDAARADLEGYLTGDRWYQSLGEGAPRTIAYFSPEFGITAVLPQYSGGLGILAGDHLKTASDLGVPIVGVGLLYRHGYFQQSLSREAWQEDTYPVVDPDGLPLSVLREEDGSPAQVSVGLPDGDRLTARIWVAQVGRVPLLLLDSDVEENNEVLRDVTDRLYGGNTEHRLRQEMLLGIGGVRALRAYSRITGAPAPEVFHTNEGHAGFLGLERIRELTEGSEQLDFDTALEVSRAGTVFTTHTPVPAGHDMFPPELIDAQTRFFVNPTGRFVVGGPMGDADKRAPWIERQHGKLERTLAAYSRGIEGHNWLYRDAFGLADICAGYALFYLDQVLAAVDWRSGFPNLAAYAERLATRPSFSSTVPSPS